MEKIHVSGYLIDIVKRPAHLKAPRVKKKVNPAYFPLEDGPDIRYSAVFQPKTIDFKPNIELITRPSNKVGYTGAGYPANLISGPFPPVHIPGASMHN